jgi:hypothetical protein
MTRAPQLCTRLYAEKEKDQKRTSREGKMEACPEPGRRDGEWNLDHWNDSHLVIKLQSMALTCS